MSNKRIILFSVFISIVFLLFGSIVLHSNFYNVSNNVDTTAIENSNAIQCYNSNDFNFFSFLKNAIFSQKATDDSNENLGEVMLGGMPIGLQIKPSGVIVVKKVTIDTTYGKVEPKSDIEIGDIITELNGVNIYSVSDIVAVMDSYSSKENVMEIKVTRADTEMKSLLYPVIEEYSNNYKLGLLVKDCAEGIGTVTYIDKDNNFGSLGHAINSANGKDIVMPDSGNVYSCKILGYIKGMRGQAGELKGTFVNENYPIGSLIANSKFGVFGKFFKSFDNNYIKIGSKDSVKPGKAKIATTIDDKIEFYDIEIIKAQYQFANEEKGLIIRVTDKKLIEKTGGIVQGMSGSPIIQNGNLVGAVTHVFVNDPKKGYGIYIENMIDITNSENEELIDNVA